MSNNFLEKVTFIWDLADLLRGTYKRNEYQKVILPFAVLKRFDCLLQYSKADVIDTYHKYNVMDEGLDRILLELAVDKNNNKLGFYNYSQYDFFSLLGDPKNIKENFMVYFNSFSPNVLDILNNFDIEEQINRLVDNDLLFILIEKFNQIDLGQDNVSNSEMGNIFEALIVKSIETSNGEGGEYFTPKDVVELMIKLLISESHTLDKKTQIKIYDPTSGTGGLLTRCKDRLQNSLDSTEIELYGQEINKEILAVCKSEMLIRGEDPEKIKGPFSTLTDDKLPTDKFDLIISQPPFGLKWDRDKEKIINETKKGFEGRFGAGTPRINDSQLLFLQHMLSKMNKDETTRIVTITTGTPLFGGDAGSGESNIRKWIIENDYLECVIALPSQLFYNTNIMTYIWVLTNKKSSKRVGKIQLIDSVSVYEKMKKRVDSKIKRFSNEDIDGIINTYIQFEENRNSRIFDKEECGYTNIAVKTITNEENRENVMFYDKVPLKQDINKYFNEEIIPYHRNAEMIYDRNKIGYEINFIELFYRYHPPISLKTNIPLKKLSNIASIDFLKNNNVNENDVIIIPSVLSKDVMLKLEFIDDDLYLKSKNSFSHYFECKVFEKEAVLPQYLKIYLNSELGKYQRRLFSRGSALMKMSKSGLGSIYIGIPDLETQKKIVSADQKITEWYNETLTLYERFYNKIFNYDDILNIISTFKKDEAFFDSDGALDIKERLYKKRDPLYDDLIWPLATSYLSATKGSSEIVEKAHKYFNLFEFIAAFNSIVLLSALPEKVYYNNIDNIWGNVKDYRKISFGNWVSLYRNLSNIFHKKEMNIPLGIDFYKQISNPKMIKILNMIPQKRNKAVHGQPLSRNKAELIVNELDPYLSDVFNILKSYNSLKLVQVVDIKNATKNDYTYDIISLNGACTPPIYTTLTTKEPMELNNMYLYNPSTEERLMLKNRLVKFIECDKCNLWSLYLYNSIKKDKKSTKALYSSFQTEEHDYEVLNLDINDIINFN